MCVSFKLLIIKSLERCGAVGIGVLERVCVDSAAKQPAKRSPELDVKDGVYERVDGGGGIAEPQGTLV